MTTLWSKKAIVAVALPASCLLMFYSLAAHMYLNLGRWPDSIGNHGFSATLQAHARLQFWWLSVVTQISIYGWPPVLLISAAIPAARRFFPYVIMYALAALVCFFFMMALAPSGFRYWWLD